MFYLHLKTVPLQSASRSTKASTISSRRRVCFIMTMLNDNQWLHANGRLIQALSTSESSRKKELEPSLHFWTFAPLKGVSTSTSVPVRKSQASSLPEHSSSLFFFFLSFCECTNHHNVNTQPQDYNFAHHTHTPLKQLTSGTAIIFWVTMLSKMKEKATWSSSSRRGLIAFSNRASLSSFCNKSKKHQWLTLD